MTFIRDVPDSNLDQNIECPEAFVILLQRYTNPVRHVTRATTFCTLAPKLYGSSVRTFVSPICRYNLEMARIFWEWFLYFAPLILLRSSR
jgi:hypothetical protein